MRHLKLTLAAVGAASLIAGCGGGSTPTITGLAATGAAVANAPVVAKCANGTTASSTTGADGSFSIVLYGGQQAPCLLQVKKDDVILHGFAGEVGRANVTPLTDLVVSAALGEGGDAATAFNSFDSAKGSTIKTGLAQAKSAVMALVKEATGTVPNGDILTGAFKVGDADDKVLDEFKLARAQSGRSDEELKKAVTYAGVAATAARGALIEDPAVLTTIPAIAFNTPQLTPLTGTPKCDVKVVALNYATVGVKGEPTNASGVMLVPTGAGCTAPTGLVAYAKGTDVQKTRTLANPADGETGLLAAMYAAQGYVVVATDYLGFAKSNYRFHPYLHADSEASSVIDSIRAARNAASAVGANLSGKVMLTGYSQGGHSSMAAHRAIERDHADEITVVAGAHLAGPYNLSGSLQTDSAIAGYQFFVPYLITAWQKVYGTVYSAVTDVFKAPYAGYVETLLPSATLNYASLVGSGKLPGINGETPAQARDAMFQSAYIADARTNPNSGLFLAGKKNDLLGWNPKSMTMLCGGAGDPTVPPLLHQVPMKADFDSRSLPNIITVDVDAYVQATFAPGGIAPTDPTSPAFATYYGSYHGTYEPPFCHAQAKGLFDLVSAAP